MRDPAAFDFEPRILAMKDRLYLTVLTILKNEEDAKDALQETVYLAYLRLGQLKDETAFEAWVTKIALREAYKLYRRRKKRAIMETEPEERLFSEDTAQNDLEFFSLIASLDKKDQTVILLYFYHDLKLEEMAKLLHLPLSTVKSRLYRAVEKIKKQWEESK